MGLISFHFHCISLVQFSHSIVSDSLWPYGLQHARLPCPSSTPLAFSDLCPSSRWCHPTISSSVITFLLLPSVFPRIRILSIESVLCIRWPKCRGFSFSIILSNEYLGLIYFRIDLLDLLAVQRTLNSSPTPQFKSISSSVLSFLYGATFTSIHDYWRNHSFDLMDLCQQIPHHFCSRLFPQILKYFSAVSSLICYSHHWQSHYIFFNMI